MPNIATALLLSILVTVMACQDVKIVATENQTDTSTSTDTGETGSTIPATFQWSSSPGLIQPPNGTVAIKDPSVLFYANEWHVYATTKSSATDDWSMVYLSFSDWDSAGAAPMTMVSENPNLDGYKTSPQFFYFAPQQKWYLVYQTPSPSYSTSDDPRDVNNWSPATRFMDNPTGVTIAGASGIDYWIICDDQDCHLFFTDLQGGLYRSATSKADFPNGFSEENTVVVMQDTANRFSLFQGCNVYKIENTDEYLLIISAIGGIGRYFRAWTAERLDGSWTPLADTADNPFASSENAVGDDWALDGINAGEMLRDNPDETLTISTSNMRYLYHGLINEHETDYDLNEYSLGLLTYTDSQ